MKMFGEIQMSWVKFQKCATIKSKTSKWGENDLEFPSKWNVLGAYFL